MEEKKQDITFEYQEGQEFFTDIIEINVVDDTVCLGLGIKSRDRHKAVVKTRVFMTLNHFFIFMDTGQELTSRIKIDLAKLNKG